MEAHQLTGKHPIDRTAGEPLWQALARRTVDIVLATAIVIVGRRLLLGPLIGTALIIVQQTFFSIGGDGDKIILG